MINDDYIINYFYGKTCLKGKLLKNIPNDILEYLENRYNDSNSIKETIYRIKNHIDIRPQCPICGNPVIFKDKGFFSITCSKKCTNQLRLLHIKQTLINHYGVDNCQRVKSIQEKTKQTCLEKYGVKCAWNNGKSKQTCLEKYGKENYVQTDEFKEKSKQTCLKKYGVEYSFQSKNNKEKSKQTCLERYGKENYVQTEEFKKKSKQTYLERYGNKNYVNSKLINESKLKNHNGKYYNLDKYHKTCLEKYGTLHWKQSEYGKEIGSKIMSNPKTQEKRNQTLKEHNTYHTSQIEELLKQYFTKNNIKFIYQYTSKLYPFKCDFYLIDYKLYIEIHGIWTHGGKPYEGTQKDNLLLNEWKNKNTEYYNNAIKTWTYYDVKKRNIAQENNLNYLEIFSIDLNYCINKINEKILLLNCK